MSFGNSVWERDGSDEMSKPAFTLMLTVWTVLGLGASAGAAYYSRGWELTLWFVLGVLASAIAGIVIALRSDRPLVSLLGYGMVAVPFGLMLGPVVALYTTASVFKVLLVTVGVTLVTGLIGVVVPDSLESWGSYLFGGLLILLLGTFLVPVAGFFGLPVAGALTALDWFGVVLFSGYIIFDMNRAMRVPHTHDNAIDCALAVYLDIINLFIRLLSLMGQRKD